METETKRRTLVREILEKTTPSNISSIKPIPIHQKPENFVTENGIRTVDNRQLDEIRKISSKYSFLSQKFEKFLKIFNK